MSTIVQWGLFSVGLFFLLLHAGPLVRVARVPSIHAGTRWWFFALEVLLFLGWIFGCPAVWSSPLGRVAATIHLSLHVSFALADWFAHDWLLASALVDRRRSPSLWAASQVGLFVDTCTHAIVVAIAGAALSPVVATLLAAPAVLAYRAMTRSYIRRFGRRSEGGR